MNITGDVRSEPRMLSNRKNHALFNHYYLQNAFLFLQIIAGPFIAKVNVV